MGRAPCCDKANVKKGPWSPEEDRKLKEYIQTHGTGGNWIALPQKAGLRRCGKSCRLRWLNYLRPNIKHGEFSDDEDKIICTLFASIGSRWSIMAAQLPGRTDNDIKNYWNTKLKKKMMMMMNSCLISMPTHETRKQPLHHHHHLDQSFNSSTNYYSYDDPSQSIFHNSNINVKAHPLSSSSTTYMYNNSSTNTTSTYHDDQTPLSSIPSTPTTAAAPASASHNNNHHPVVVQSQDQHGYLLDSTGSIIKGKGNYQQGVKDSSALVMFGKGQDKTAASSSSNSDGSCSRHYDQYGCSSAGHVHAHNNNMGNLKSDSYMNNKEFGVNIYEKAEKGNNYGDPSSLDSCLEEIKQLISTTNLCSCSSSNIDDNNLNLNFFVDETKEEVVEKLMYY